MMKRIKAWLYGEHEEEATPREAEAEGEQNTEIADTRQLIRESEAKSREAGERLDEYQERIQRETRKRLEVATGGRLKDE